MSLLNLFDIAKSAIFANQTALNVTTNNIANVNTAGYTRKEAIFSSSSPVIIGGNLLGRGVSIDSIKRYYDIFIQNQLLDQYQNTGKSYALNETFGQIEQIFNEVKNMGLATPLRDFFKAWQDVATNPEGFAQRTVLLQKAESLVSSAKQMERRITETIRDINETIDTIVGRINVIASDIAVINDKIAQVEAGSEVESAHDLRDKRDQLLNELSDLIEFTSYEDDNGSITVIVGMRNLVSGNKSSILSAEVDNDGDYDLFLDNINITARINKGKIGGFLSAREDIESNSLINLRKLIASLVKEINLIHRVGYGLDSTTGNNFFSDLELSTRDYSEGADITATINDLSLLTLDEYDISFDSSNNYYVYNRQTGELVTSGLFIPGNPINFDGIEVVITGSISATDSFFISPLTDAIKNFGVAITDTDKIAAAQFSSALPGDNRNALQIAQLLDTSIGNLGDSTFINYYNGILSDIGSKSSAASDSLNFDKNLLYELQNMRESVSGISLDEEAANLLRFQRSFEAAAKMFKVTDELLQTILSI